MLLQLLFLTNITFIFIHELDAIQQSEWRFFFTKIPISDVLAYRLFTFLHLPLFVFMLWNLSATWFQVGFDIFMLIHAVLHTVLRNHPKVNFNNNFSRVWIFGGAFLAIIHLFLLIGLSA